MEDLKLMEQAETVNRLLARYGVKFGIYKNNEFKEQLFPFDTIPRIIEKQAFAYLERGLKQRVTALNAFIKDIYGKKFSHCPLQNKENARLIVHLAQKYHNLNILFSPAGKHSHFDGPGQGKAV